MNTNRAIKCRACFTIIRAVTPPELSKAFRLEHDELISHAAAHMVEGVAQLAHVEGTAVARSKAHFVFPDGPGLLCLDYDPQTLQVRRRSGVAIDDQ